MFWDHLGEAYLEAAGISKYKVSEAVRPIRNAVGNRQPKLRSALPNNIYVRDDNPDICPALASHSVRILGQEYPHPEAVHYRELPTPSLGAKSECLVEQQRGIKIDTYNLRNSLCVQFGAWGNVRLSYSAKGPAGIICH